MTANTLLRIDPCCAYAMAQSELFFAHGVVGTV
jgi:hypothetical protein